jgi:hypothetical protein
MKQPASELPWSRQRRQLLALKHQRRFWLLRGIAQHAGKTRIARCFRHTRRYLNVSTKAASSKAGGRIE